MEKTVKCSELGTSGFTYTNTDLHRWCGELVKKVRAVFKDERPIARICAYRVVDVGVEDFEALACDFYSEEHEERRVSVTLQAVGCYDFSTEDACVQDMTEAVHAVGLMTQALKPEIRIGRGQNEVNESVLAVPLGEGHTNGRIDLWKEA
ncbi:MAG: hypothetical protein GY710_15690 [Desulfobacteraceae bacterium]|nr:hypothetical protein [Desulfobacteraceae bacterium]